MKNKPEPIIKKEYKEKLKPTLVRFNNDFIADFFIDEKTKSFIEVPINAMRIIFNIIATIREEQIYLNDKDNQAQLRLSLFDNEFMNENNTYARFNIKNSSIISNGKTKALKDAYKFLVEFKADWYYSKNENGEKVGTFGGIIQAPTVSKGYTQFLVSSYWLKKLITLPTYNTTLYNLVYNISDNKKVLFFFWVNSLLDKGTMVKHETLNQKFNLNYKSAKGLCDNFLKSARDDFDKYSHKSFNYSRKGNVINIVPYATKTVENATNKETVIVENNYKVSYIKNRHSLSKEQVVLLKNLIKNSGTTRKVIFNAYKSFVDEVININRRERKNIKTTDFQKDEFFKIFQKHITEEYKKTKGYKINPKAEPRII